MRLAKVCVWVMSVVFVLALAGGAFAQGVGAGTNGTGAGDTSTVQSGSTNAVGGATGSGANAGAGDAAGGAAGTGDGWRMDGTTMAIGGAILLLAMLAYAMSRSNSHRRDMIHS